MARSIPMLRLATAIPVSVAVLTVAVPILVVSPADAAAGAAGRGPRPPSYREVLTHSAFARAAVPADAPFVLKNGRMPADSLQKALDRWVKDHSTVTSVAVGVAVEGQIWTGDARRTRRPPVASAADRFRVQSLTKTFTIALVLREVEAGRIALDAPVPRLRGVVSSRSWPAITPRQLLMHTSGLINYPEAPGYRADRPVTPEAAVNLALRAPRVGEPGERVHYSNTNYLYLGVLLEAVAGRPYAELLRDLTAPMGLADTGLEPPPEGWAWHASGGVHSTVGDMARWGSALFTPGAVLPPHRTADLTTVTDHYVGLGTWPMCPCSTDDTGTKRYTAIGQYVGFGGMYHFPRQMTLVVRLEPESGDAADLYADLSRHLGDVFRTAR